MILRLSLFLYCKVYGFDLCISYWFYRLGYLYVGSLAGDYKILISVKGGLWSHHISYHLYCTWKLSIFKLYFHLFVWNYIVLLYNFMVMEGFLKQGSSLLTLFDSSHSNKCLSTEIKASWLRCQQNMDECRLCHIVSLGLQGVILFMKVVKAQLSLLINFVRSMLLLYYPVLKKMQNLLFWKSFTRPTYKLITLKIL